MSRRNTAIDIFEPEGVILKYLEKYEGHLFGHPTLRNEDGRIVAVVERTNNVPEHFFGEEKRKLRRRVGRAHLSRDLEDQPAQAALAANLQSAEYVRVVCGSLGNLDRAFASLSEAELEQATPLSRSNRDSKVIQRIRELVKNETISPNPTAEIGAKEGSAGDTATVV